MRARPASTRPCGSAACSVCSSRRSGNSDRMTVGCAPCEEDVYSPLGIYCNLARRSGRRTKELHPMRRTAPSATMERRPQSRACPPPDGSASARVRPSRNARFASLVASLRPLGQAKCDQCDAGRFSAAPGASSCVDCAPKRHRDASGRSNCEDAKDGVLVLGRTWHDPPRELPAVRRGAHELPVAAPHAVTCARRTTTTTGGEVHQMSPVGAWSRNSTGSPPDPDEELRSCSGRTTPANRTCRRNDG